MYLGKIKICLILYSRIVPYWVCLLIKNLKKLDFVLLYFVIHDTSTSVNEKISITSQNSISKTKMIFHFYEKYERKRIRTHLDLSQLIDFSTIVNKEKYAERTHQDDYDFFEIKDRDLDVIINLSGEEIPDYLSHVPRFGVWSYRHMKNSDEYDYSGFWEVYNERLVSSTVLQIVIGGKKITDVSYWSSDPLYFLRNRSIEHLKRTIIIPRMLKKLHLSEPSTILHHDEMKCSHHNEKLIHIPTGKQIIKFFFKNTFRYLMFKKTNYKKVEQWCLLFYLFNNKSKMQRKFQRIIPPKDRFYADPFVVKKGKRYFVFIEEFVSALPAPRPAPNP